jgi:lysophospholipase L1-like esterase
MLGNTPLSTTDRPLRKSPDRITVVGYGGCMVTGYPLPEESGFMRIAVTGAQADTDTDIDLKVFGITSCPATKAAEQLKEKALSHHPDIVVLQFGQSDAKVAMKRLWHETFGGTRASSSNPPAVTEKLMTRRDRVDLFLRGCGGLIVRAQPVTPRADYRRSIAEVVEAVVATGAYAIVLTPFVFENFLADAWAHCYSYDLESDFAGRADVRVINVWDLLAEHPRGKMLLHDGLHLSRSAHALLAESLQSSLVERIRARALVP